MSESGYHRKSSLVKNKKPLPAGAIIGKHLVMVGAKKKAGGALGSAGLDEPPQFTTAVMSTQLRSRRGLALERFALLSTERVTAQRE